MQWVEVSVEDVEAYLKWVNTSPSAGVFIITAPGDVEGGEVEVRLPKIVWPEE